MEKTNCRLRNDCSSRFLCCRHCKNKCEYACRMKSKDCKWLSDKEFITTDGWKPRKL